MRKKEFAVGEFYHIYNRGVDKRDVFLDDFYYQRFLISMSLLNDKKEGLLDYWRNEKRSNPDLDLADFRRLNLRSPIVDIIAYCLNPNHYHFILRQSEEKGIEKFMQRLGTAYTMFFNKKNKRSGALFQGRFKSIHIDSNEYLLYLSAYVNKNNFIHGYDFSNWKYSSLNEYVKCSAKVEPSEKICNPLPVLDQFGDVDEYVRFIEKNAIYLRNKKEDLKYLLEE